MSSILTILITLVRHGKTQYNVEHIIQGQFDAPLNEEGKYQAVLAGKSLKNNHFDVIYSSDLSRAFDTAKTIVEENDVIRQPHVIMPEVLLRETCHGVFENRPSPELNVAAKAAGFVEPNLRKFRPEGGENQDDVSLRAKQFLAKILEEKCTKQKEEGNRILVVSHGLFIREFLRILLEKETSEGSSVEKWKNILISGTGPNTGISKFYLKVSTTCDIISTKCLLFLSDDHLSTCPLK